MKTDWHSFVRFTEKLRDRARKRDQAIHDAGWELAATVQIPRDMCCLHNASIDDEMKGWCKDSPERLAVAKKAIELVHSWPNSRRADHIYRLAWNRMAKANKLAKMA